MTLVAKSEWEQSWYRCVGNNSKPALWGPSHLSDAKKVLLSTVLSTMLPLQYPLWPAGGILAVL